MLLTDFVSNFCLFFERRRPIESQSALDQHWRRIIPAKDGQTQPGELGIQMACRMAAKLPLARARDTELLVCCRHVARLRDSAT